MVKPTTVHIPRALLASVDRKARALRLSRDELIVKALTREVGGSAGWSPKFLARLRNVESDTRADVDALLNSRCPRSRLPAADAPTEDCLGTQRRRVTPNGAAPLGAEPKGRDERLGGEHQVGLFGGRTRLR